MSILTITLDEKLSSQILEAAKARGADAGKMAVDVLKQAFSGPAQGTPEPPLPSVQAEPTAEQFLALLAPVWAEQRRPTSANGSESEEGAGDIYEAKLAQYYAEDYDRTQGRRP